MALRDLFVRFKIGVEGKEKLDAADRSIRKAKDSSEDLGKKLKQLGQIFATGWLARGVKNFVEDLIQQADALDHSAEMLGVTTDELQKYQYVAGLMQVPLQNAAVAMRFFNRAVGEASFGTKSAVTAFGRLGMKVTDAHGQVRPTSELLFEFADRLKGVRSQAQRTAIAMRTLGRGGAAMLPALQNGSAALREMFKDVDELGGGFDKDFIEKAHEVDRQQKRLAMGWRTMTALLGKELLPMLGKLAERSIKTVKVFIDFAKQTYWMRTALYAVVPIMTAVALGWAAMNTAMIPSLIAWGLLAAAVGAVYIVFDDLYTFLQGGESIIGRILDQIGGKGHAKEVLDQLTTAFNSIKDALGSSDASGKSLGVTLIGLFLNSIPYMVEWSGKFATYVIQAIGWAIKEAKEAGAIFDWLFSKHGKADTAKLNDKIDAEENKFRAMADALGKGRDALSALTTAPASRTVTYDATSGENAPGVGTGTRVPGEGSAPPAPYRYNELPAPPAPPMAPSGDAGVPIHIENHITIHGAADPNKVADAAEKGTKDGLKTAASQNRDTYSAVTDGMPTYSSVGAGQ